MLASSPFETDAASRALPLESNGESQAHNGTRSCAQASGQHGRSQEGRYLRVSVSNNLFAKFKTEDDGPAVMVERPSNVKRRHGISGELSHAFIRSEMEETGASMHEKAVVLHALACAHAKQSSGLPNRCRGGSYGGQQILLSIDELRVDSEVGIEVVVESHADSATQLPETVQIVDVELRAQFNARNFSVGASLRVHSGRNHQ